jgi:hypothetical protein
MRMVCGAVLAASLFVPLFIPLLVSGALAGPLLPGYPAGVKAAARSGSTNTALMIGTGAVIMAGVGILISGDSSTVDTLQITSQPIIVGPPVSTVTTTSTTP